MVRETVPDEQKGTAEKAYDAAAQTVQHFVLNAALNCQQKGVDLHAPRRYVRVHVAGTA